MKITKYNNEFANVDETSIGSAINDFIRSLENVNYTSTGCYEMSTGAKYDTTFNQGFDKLKDPDIQSMINLCNNCNTNIIQQITTYKNNYADYERAYTTYDTNYTNYEKAYQTWENNKKEGPKPTEPSSAGITEQATALKELATTIKNTTFN